MENSKYVQLVEQVSGATAGVGKGDACDVSVSMAYSRTYGYDLKARRMINGVYLTRMAAQPPQKHETAL